MPVNSTHPEYDSTLRAWLRARDVLAGEDAVKDGGEKYLPRLEEQTDDEYDAYRARLTAQEILERIRRATQTGTGVPPSPAPPTNCPGGNCAVTAAS